MKVAFTTDYYWPHAGGGVEAVVRQVATRLARWGHEVTVVTLRPRGAPARESVEGVTVVRVPGIEPGRALHLSLAFPTRAGFLDELAQADVVNLHNPFFGTSMLAGLRVRRPLVATLHVGSFARLGWPLAWGVRLFEGTLGRRILRRSRLVTAVSQDAARAAARWGVDPGGVAVIPNGVDTDAFQPNGEARAKRLLYVGRLTRNKGAHVLAQAMPRILEAHPDAEIHFVGAGPMATRLRRQAARMGAVADAAASKRARSGAGPVAHANIVSHDRAPAGVDANTVPGARANAVPGAYANAILGAPATPVSDAYASTIPSADSGTGPDGRRARSHPAAFHGHVPAVAPFLREAAVYVRPSLTDGMPLCVLEAMACGTPVVASDVGGTREVLLHGEEGLLVPPGSARELADACIAMLDQPQRARAMGHAARRRAAQGPSWDEVARRYLEAFEAVAAGRTAGDLGL